MCSYHGAKPVENIALFFTLTGGGSLAAGGTIMSGTAIAAAGATGIAAGAAFMAGRAGNFLNNSTDNFRQADGIKPQMANRGHSANARTTPNNLNEQLFMEQVKSNPLEHLLH